MTNPMKRWLPCLVVSTATLLPNTTVFGQAETKPAVEDTKQVEAKKDTADDQEAPEKKQPSVRQQINTLLGSSKLEEASELIDGLDQDSTETDQLRSQLVYRYLRQRNYEGAVGQFEKQLQLQMNKEDFSARKIAAHVYSLRTYLPRVDRTEDIMPLIDKASQLVSTKVDPAKASEDMEALLRLNASKSSVLRSDGKLEEAKSILEHDLEATKKLHAKEDSDISARIYLASIRNLMPDITDVDARLELLTVHQDVASQLAEEGDAGMAVSFVQTGLSEVGRIYRSQPVAADELLKTIKEFASHHSENEKTAARLRVYNRTISTLDSRLQSAKKILEMIGKQAPVMEADVNWVGVDEPVDTNGKVVLLDFWALWCGPCIRTFPHLKHLTEEYGDKGLQVVGVTRYYNYTWDEETDRPKAGDRSADPNPEVENEVLQKFFASHDLTHPTVVVSKDSTLHNDFGVSGIPHVAILDQQGRIQMVKIGSGEDNAVAIEAKIKELLGLTESSEADTGQ